MIVFDLGCSRGHRFEAWFPNSAAFEQQNAAGELDCPQCGDRSLLKAPMAPHVARPSRRGELPVAEGGETPPAADDREKLRKALEGLRRHVTRTCDDVGDRFPEEARRIHYGESEARGIYGEADIGTARELRDEGIDICPLPLLPRRDG